MKSEVPLSAPELRKMARILAWVDCVLAFALMAWQSISAHRVSLMQIVVSDFFWMAVLWICILKFKVPAWVVKFQCVILFLGGLVPGAMRVFASVSLGKLGLELVNGSYLLGGILNFCCFILWLRNHEADTLSRL